jgi:GNAT superfamily N-acetyltransferase
MISFRNATAADGAVLGGLYRATFLETFAHLYKRPDLEAFLASRSDEAFTSLLAEPETEVRFATIETAPIGFCTLTALGLPATPDGPAIELSHLYLFKPWHGQGIAEQLMDWAFTRAQTRGIHEIWLSVFTENHRARRFYARQGFKEIRPYAFMVGTQADEDILCRKLLP